MKSKSVLKLVLNSMLLASILTLSSCGSGSGEKNSENSSDSTLAEASVSGNPEFKSDTVKSVFEHYIHVKDALVEADNQNAKTGAAQLQAALIAAGSDKGAEIAGKMAASADVAVQRAELQVLTAEVENIIKSGKLASGTVFKQFCPMARDGEGGYWLSDNSAIKNPYYGDEMLECGEVKEEIK